MNNTDSFTPSSVDSWLLSRKILSEGGLDATITLVGPGVETPRPDLPSAQAIVLYVSEGSVTASLDRSNFILRKDEAFYIAAGKVHTLRNHTQAPAKVVALALPVARRETPPLVVGFP